jgi:hypothetical protein
MDNIEIRGGMERIELAEDRDQQRVFMTTVMNLQVS